MLSLIAEFFEFYQMEYSLSVFLPEANITKKDFDRSSLAKSSGLSKPNPDKPILQQMISDFLKGNVSKGPTLPTGNNEEKKNKEQEKEKEKERTKPTVITGPLKVGPGGTSANSATAGKTPQSTNSSLNNVKILNYVFFDNIHKMDFSNNEKVYLKTPF